VSGAHASAVAHRWALIDGCRRDGNQARWRPFAMASMPPQRDGNLVGLDAIALGLAAVDGFPVEGMTEDEGDR